MFTYNEIEHLLSKPARTALADSEKFAQISASAEDIMTNITGYDETELASYGWAKPAFVFLLEYFVYNRIENITQEFQAKANKNYSIAMDILKSNKKSLAASKLGNIEGLYESEF